MMKQRQILSLACILFLIPACGPTPVDPMTLLGLSKILSEDKGDKQAAPVPSVSADSANSSQAGSSDAGDGNTISKAPTTCATADDASLDPARVIQRQTVKIRRHLQRVIRKNCQGEVISDQVETVKSPNTIFDLKAQTLHFWNRVDIHSAYNRTTCDYGKYRDPLTQTLLLIIDLVTFNWDDVYISPRTIRMTLDTSPAFFHTHVDRHRANYIDYEFRKCESVRVENGTKSCVKSSPQELGTLVLTVDYQEDQLDGVSEIRVCKEEEAETAAGS